MADKSFIPLEDSVPKEVFKEEVMIWAKRVGVTPAEIHIQPMKHKWGSCSSRGRLTFNSQLLKESAAFRAEIIVHELLHLKLPNHGKLFNSLVKAYLTKYRSFIPTSPN